MDVWVNARLIDLPASFLCNAMRSSSSSSFIHSFVAGRRCCGLRTPRDRRYDLG